MDNDGIVRGSSLDFVDPGDGRRIERVGGEAVNRFSRQCDQLARAQQYRLDPRGALFDMVADPNQQTDIAQQQSEIASKMRSPSRSVTVVGTGIDMVTSVLQRAGVAGVAGAADQDQAVLKQRGVEQRAAVEKTHAYFHSIWKENKHAVPRFLWNAKMRFGKTFTTYQLAKKLGAKRVLVVTFKPAVEDAWQTDLESHADFDGWQYQSRNSDSDPTKVSAKKPLVYFGSFQDLLGRDDVGNIKPKNTWLHKVKWDLVVFDEYHFGAWRQARGVIVQKDAPLLDDARDAPGGVAQRQPVRLVLEERGTKGPGSGGERWMHEFVPPEVFGVIRVPFSVFVKTPYQPSTQDNNGKLDLGTEDIDLVWTIKPRGGAGIGGGSIANPYIRLGGTLASPRVIVTVAVAKSAPG